MRLFLLHCFGFRGLNFIENLDSQLVYKVLVLCGDLEPLKNLFRWSLSKVCLEDSQVFFLLDLILLELLLMLGQVLFHLP